MEDPQSVMELNVGGVHYSSSLATLRREPDSLLARLFAAGTKSKLPKDAANRYFLDRDGVLFRYILDYLRNSNLLLPDNFFEVSRLRQEAQYFQLPQLVKILDTQPSNKPVFSFPPDFLQSVIGANKQQILAQQPLQHLTPASAACITAPPSTSTPNQALAVTSSTSSSPTFTANNNHGNNTDTNSISRTNSPSTEGRPCGAITLGYRGTFAFGRDGLADVKFRKLSRIIVCGKVSLCREVFKDTLNESRDPDRGETDRYTSRFFLKHSFLEQAFDMLQEEGFVCIASCGSGTNSAGEVKPGLDTEEAKWQHYNEFIFERRGTTPPHVVVN